MPDVESGRASKFARFPPKTGFTRLPCFEFRFLPRKACRFVTTRFLGAKVHKTRPSSRAPSPQGFRGPTARRLNVRQPVEVVRQPSLSPRMSPLHPAPFFQVRRVRFSCRAASGMPKPPNSQVFGGKLCLVFRFRAGKAANPPSLSPLVTASFVTALFGPAELVTTAVTAPSGSVFLVQKALKTVESSEESVFRVGLRDAQASKFAGFRWKAGSRRPLCSVFRFRAGKAANSSPSMSPLVTASSPLVTASSPLSLGPPSLSPLLSPHPAPFFWCKKRLKRSSLPKSPFFVLGCGMPKPPNSQVFGGKRAPDDHFAQFSAFGPEKRRIPACRACHRLSPLRYRSLWGRKVRKKKGLRNQLRGFDGFANPG